jgi:hypothetical protein
MLRGIKIIPASELSKENENKQIVTLREDWMTGNTKGDSPILQVGPPLDVRPQNQTSTQSITSTSWRQTSLDRARERAKSEGKSVDEILFSIIGKTEKEFMETIENENTGVEMKRSPTVMKRPDVSMDLKWTDRVTPMSVPTKVIPIVTKPSIQVPNEIDLNRLTAKSLKSSMMGDKEAEDKISAEIEHLKSQLGIHPPETVVVLADTDSKGAKYRKTDEKSTLADLVHEEKTTRGNREYHHVTTIGTKDSDDQYDQIDLSQTNKKRSREESKIKQKQIHDHQKQKSLTETCKLCYGSETIKKHCVIALGEKCTLSIPYFGSLVKGHCIISPLEHRVATNQCDEDEFMEIMKFKRSLKQMFAKNGLDCVFMETVTSFNMKKQFHAFIECIPVPHEVFEMVPGYFKKALDDSESEWSQNKKVIDTRGRGIVKSVPRDFPYFHVEFTMNGGYAPVIENEKKFRYYFGREVLGDVLDLQESLTKEREVEEQEERDI